LLHLSGYQASRLTQHSAFQPGDKECAKPA
jgi:hypothetical protein